MRNKRQVTMAKLARERLVQERRALKREKKQAARDARAKEAEVAADAGESAPAVGDTPSG
jgi:hypothetical protein